MSMPEADAQLPLKKRARRRLIGAVAIAVFAAVVLPMVMDQAPQAPVADVEIRIPGQDQVPPLVPRSPVAEPSAPAAVAEKAVERPVEKAAEKAPPAAAKPAAEAVRPAEKTADKTVAKPAAKVPERPTANGDDARRAAAILSGKAQEPAAPQQHVILIGAFANPGNVKVLQSKLGELGIKVYTELLESPQGRKTRVRAGPFPTRDAAEKALERMKRIGVNGVVAIKQ